MMYIAGAPHTFKKQGAQKRHAIAPEITILELSRVNIYDPDEKYSLKSLLGKFSGLHLLASMYTAFCQIDSTMDTGLYFAAEYKAAMEMQKA
jgi:hypothetical protein